MGCRLVVVVLVVLLLIPIGVSSCCRRNLAPVAVREMSSLIEIMLRASRIQANNTIPPQNQTIIQSVQKQSIKSLAPPNRKTKYRREENLVRAVIDQVFRSISSLTDVGDPDWMHAMDKQVYIIPGPDQAQPSINKHQPAHASFVASQFIKARHVLETMRIDLFAFLDPTTVNLFLFLV